MSVGDFFGGLFGGAAGAAGSVYAAERQIKFQREMAKNRYQYLVSDLEKANLNRMLALGGGSAQPPGVPPGAMADVAGGAAKGVAAGRSVAEMRRRAIEADVKKTWSEVDRNREEAWAARSRGNLNNEEMKLLRTQLPAAQAAADFDSSALGQFLKKWQTGIGRMLPGAGVFLRKGR